MFSYQRLEGVFEDALGWPGLEPPPGVVSNLINPANIDGLTYATVTLCIIFSMMAISSRVYTKLWIVKSFSLDDWTALIGFVFAVVFTALTAALARDGAGRHQWDVRLINLPHILYNFNTLMVFYCFTTFFIQASILIQYLRVLVPTGQRNATWWGCWTMMISSIIFYVSLFFSEVFQCNPRQKIWQPWVSGQCLDSASLNIAVGALDSIQVAAIIAIPTISLLRMDLPAGQKLRASLALPLAIFALVAAIVRTVYAAKLKESGDDTYELQVMQLWISVEYATLITCSCLPHIPLLSGRMWPQDQSTTVVHSKYFGSFSSSSGAPAGGDLEAGAGGGGPWSADFKERYYGGAGLGRDSPFSWVCGSSAAEGGSEKDRDDEKMPCRPEQAHSRRGSMAKYGGIMVTKDVIIKRERLSVFQRMRVLH